MPWVECIDGYRHVYRPMLMPSHKRPLRFLPMQGVWKWIYPGDEFRSSSLLIKDFQMSAQQRRATP